MDTITVDKAQLIATMTENRSKHQGIFLKAQAGYREQAIQALDRKLQNAREGKINLTFSLPAPKDFTVEYDTALSMLEWAQGDSVDLDQRDFERYVLDRWDWANQFVGSTSAYLVS